MKIKYSVKQISKLDAILNYEKTIIVQFTSLGDIQNFYKKYVHNLSSEEQNLIPIENTTWKTMENFATKIFNNYSRVGINVYLTKLHDKIVHSGYNAGNHKEMNKIYTTKDLI